MDIKHQLPGDMVILLDHADLSALRTVGFCMDRKGLVGSETKTWVRRDSLIKVARICIDASSDVYVDLPNGVGDLPVRFEGPEINPYMDADRSRVDFYFGKTGAVIVQAANN